MVNTLPHSSPLSDLDPNRIAGNVAVVVVHALAFALLMLPGRWTPPADEPVDEPIVVVPIERKREIEPTIPPPIPVQVPRREPTPRDPPQRIVENLPPADTAPVFDSGELAAVPTDDAGPPVSTFDPGPPQLATLTYRHNPAPRYPRRSLKDGDEGQVLLRVLVDAQGRPIEVTIERSSGHRELDRAAREQVLEQWLFNPAQHAGVPVPAYALVPIDFSVP